MTRAWSIATERQEAQEAEEAGWPVDMDQQHAWQAERDEGDMRLGAVQLVSSQNMHS